MSIVAALSGAIASLSIAATLDQWRIRRSGRRRWAACATADVAMEPAPISAEWMIDGRPDTEAAVLARSIDETTSVFLWRTTGAHFRWHHQSDEVVTILEGEAFVRDLDAGPPAERRLGPGDVALFSAGTWTIWRVPSHLKKVSTLTRSVPAPAVGAMRWARIGKAFLRRSGTFRSRSATIGARGTVAPSSGSETSA